jgi:AraC-like DNA-binding protein
VLLLDPLLRFAGVGVLALASVVLLRGAPRELAPRLVSAFTVCVAAYLMLSPGTLAALGPLVPPLRVLAVAAPALLWLATLALFRDSFRPKLLHFAPLGVLEIASMIDGAHLVHHLLVLALYVAAAVNAWRGYAADLVESRQRFRVAFVACAVLIGVAIAVGEMVLGRAPAPAWLELLKLAAILGVAAGLLAWAIDLRPAWFAVPAPVPQPIRLTEDLAPAERQLLADLRVAIEERRAYRKEGLTIAGLAAELRVPEHALRRAINQRLGYRNFNAFLNRYRIDEVKAALADPGKARLPILTLALEAGFSSIGPFNRAFREACGTTPTEYRASRQAAEGANPSPIPESATDRRT